VNHVERFIIDEGHTAQRFGTDYGYDLIMMTFDEQGYAEPDLIYLQLKASESLVRVGENYAYDVDIRDYNLWRIERLPVILVLFDAVARRAYWVHVQNYFEDTSRQPKRGAKTVRIRIPRRQVVSRRAVARMRALKQSTAVRLVEGTSHA
jgi:hypothetical protein